MTDAIFRDLHAERFGGLDRAVAPFVRGKEGRRLRPAVLRDVEPERNGKLPVEPQILGKDPERFLTLARAMGEMGHESVSWNLGCPSRSATTKGRGAALLARPDVVEAFLEDVVPSLPLRLSVKARLGHEDDGELRALLPMLARYSVAELTIHPRITSDGFEGPLRLDAFAACLGETAVPVLWSGGIDSVATLETLVERFPTVSGWMLGRGLLADPWLAIRFKEGSGQADVEALRKFHDDLVARWQEELSGPAPVLARLVSLWSYLAPSLEGGRRVLKEARKSRTLDRYLPRARRFFEGAPRWLEAAERPRW